MANKDIDLIYEAYMEAKEAPKGKHYDSAGRLRKGDADADGRGGPKYRSDPTYVNPNDEEDIPEEDDLGLGHSTPAMIKITSIGNTTPFKKKTEAPIEDQEAAIVHIQAGEPEQQQSKHEFSYDGEIDMARAELLKATDYSSQLFDMVANTEALPGWVASKITKASDYLSSVFHYLDYEMKYNKDGDCDEETEGDDFDQANEDVEAGKSDLESRGEDS